MLTCAQVMSLDPTGTTYTFVDATTGKPTHIAARLLYNALDGRVPVVDAEIAPSLVAALKAGTLGVEPAHAKTLTPAALERPGLVGEWGNDHVLIDGAHRLWRRWQRGDKTFPVYFAPEPVWRTFVIRDMPGDGAFWDHFNRNATIRTPDMERLLKLLGG